MLAYEDNTLHTVTLPSAAQHGVHFSYLSQLPQKPPYAFNTPPRTVQCTALLQMALKVPTYTWYFSSSEARYLPPQTEPGVHIAVSL